MNRYIYFGIQHFMERKKLNKRYVHIDKISKAKKGKEMSKAQVNDSDENRSQ
jgi:hypothetical protein